MVPKPIMFIMPNSVRCFPADHGLFKEQQNKTNVVIID